MGKTIPLFDLTELLKQNAAGQDIITVNQIIFICNNPNGSLALLPATDFGHIIAVNINTRCNYGRFFERFKDKLVVIIDFANIIGRICKIIVNNNERIAGQPVLTSNIQLRQITNAKNTSLF